MSTFSSHLLEVSNGIVYQQSKIEYCKIIDACRAAAASGNFYYIHPWKLHRDVNMDIIRLLKTDDLTMYELDLKEHCGCERVKDRGSCRLHPQSKLIVTWRPNFTPNSLADAYLYTASKY